MTMLTARQVTDQMLAAAEHRFPYNPPTTKEGYRYRSIFCEFFGQPCAERTVPGGPSIACSTGRAIKVRLGVFVYAHAVGSGPRHSNKEQTALAALWECILMPTKRTGLYQQVQMPRKKAIAKRVERPSLDNCVQYNIDIHGSHKE